jgi:hypothetical protein
MFKPEYLEDFIKKNKCYSVLNAKQNNDIYKKCEKIAYYSEEFVQLYDNLQIMKMYNFIIFGLIIATILICFYELRRMKRDVLKHQCYIEQVTDVLSERINKKC